MNPRSLPLLGAFAAALVVTSIAACVGDDPGAESSASSSSGSGGSSGDGSSSGAASSGSSGGATCKANHECPSGFCADGVCCNAPCTGQCESCVEPGMTGTCTAVSGAPRNGRQACAGVGDAVCGGSCDGSNRASCTYPATECRAGSCAAGIETSAAQCKDGACPLSPQLTCGTGTASKKPYCGATSCVGATAIAAGYSSTCALMSDGTVRCWGSGERGQLGQGGTDDAYHRKPVVVKNVAGATRIAMGQRSQNDVVTACAVLTDQTVKCWGANFYGELGTGTADATNFVVHGDATIVKKDGTNNFTMLKDISVGGYFTCGLETAGNAWCWGWEFNGRLGNGTVTDTKHPLPVQVTGAGTGRAAIATGWDHACVAGSGTTASVACWGYNLSGQTGQAGGGTTTTATNVSGLTVNGAIPYPLGLGNATSCAVGSNSAVWCWGSNSSGRLGRNLASGALASSPTPLPVCRDGTHTSPCTGGNEGLTGAISIGVGEQHACAVVNGQSTSTKVVRCWGTETGSRGVLADGNVANHSVLHGGSGPTLPANAVQVAAGSYHNCAVLESGRVFCWGWNNAGQLGNDSTSPSGAGGPVESIF